MARPVFNSLQKHFPCAHFRGFDPVVRAKEIEAFGLIPCISLEDAMKGANLILILNNHSLFAHMQIENLSELLARPALIYDFWNNFVAQELHLLPGIGYMALGSHNRAVLP
jgi:UDP-N-acetyl-D-mannosaminuronate dehydrogenase